MADDGTDILHGIKAYAFQGAEAYQGADNWQTDNLKPGERLVQFDFPRPEATSKTASQFFTTYEEFEKHIDPNTGKVNASALAERIQVGAHRASGATEFNYAPKVTIYEVEKDLPAASSKVTDNVVYGRGGAEQVFTSIDTKELIANGYLKRLDEVESFNTSPKLPIYDELKNLPDDQINATIETHHNAYRKALVLSDDEKALEVFDAMNERQDFSDTARAIQDDTEAIKSAKLPRSDATNLDLDSKALSKIETIRDQNLSLTPDSRLQNIGASADEAQSLRGIGDAAAKGRLMSFAADPEGQTVYLLEKDNGVLHRFENVDGGLSYTESTNFPDTKSAGQHVSELLREAGQTYPESFKGLPNINHSLSGLEDELEHMSRPGWMKGAAGALDEGSRFLGKASKVLGPLGVFATGAEAAELELKLQDYEDFGLVPPEAMLAYRGILTGHVGQATIDPSMVGGELAVQGAYDKWVESYNIDSQTAEALEPGSLIEDLAAADRWLQAQATVAGVKTRDYVTSRWEEPELIADDMREAGEAYIEMHREAAQTIGDYAKDRWNNPEKFTEDVQGINEQIMKLTPPGQAIHYGRKLWENTLGREAASQEAMEDLGLNVDNTDKSSTDVNRDTTEITIDEARMIIDHDRPIILEDLQTKAARGGLSDREADYAEALDAPVVPVLMDTLEKGGIKTLEIPTQSLDTPQNRIDAVIDSGAKAYNDNNLPTPEADYTAAYEAQYGYNHSNNQDYDYERDDSYSYDLMG